MATAELAAWGIPPILVPLPTAAADHQTINAKTLTDAGTAEFIPQSDLSVDSIDRSVRIWLLYPTVLAEKSRAALRRARPLAAEQIARTILNLTQA